MTREELLSSEGYWIANIQINLFNQVKNYMEENNLNRTQLAEKLGVSKGYITQILNGDFDHRISKLVELSLAVGVVPDIKFKKLENYLIEDYFSYTSSLTEENPEIPNITENTIKSEKSFSKSKIKNTI